MEPRRKESPNELARTIARLRAHGEWLRETEEGLREKP